MQRHAVEQYMRAIKLRPEFAAAYSNLGTVYQRAQKIGDALLLIIIIDYYY